MWNEELPPFLIETIKDHCTVTYKTLEKSYERNCIMFCEQEEYFNIDIEKLLSTFILIYEIGSEYNIEVRFKGSNTETTGKKLLERITNYIKKQQ